MYDPSISKKNAWKISSDVEEALSLEELFSKSDFVSFHVPLVDATKNLLNAKRISLLPEGCVVINMSRDGIVDEEELVKYQDEYGDEAFTAGIGAEAILEILKSIDLENERTLLIKTINETKSKVAEERSMSFSNNCISTYATYNFGNLTCRLAFAP